MSQFDESIKEESKIYYRYMDDIVKNIKRQHCDLKLQETNNLHGSLKFTMEQEINGELPVLDMKIIHNLETGELSSTWYFKHTDTGLIMNFHALAPKRYKRSVVTGFVHRIYRACSSWQLFHESLEKAKRILERNQYSPAFYEPLIREALTTIVAEKAKKQVTDPSDKKTEGSSRKMIMMVQYRGKTSESYARALHKMDAPCMIVMTLRKMKTILPSLKPRVEKMLKSGVVYHITCPRCQACYVGQTCRHLQTRFTEHIKESGPVKKHLAQCNTNATSENVIILHQTARGVVHLQTLEALYIREFNPSINTKDEYRRRELTIKV